MQLTWAASLGVLLLTARPLVSASAATVERRFASPAVEVDGLSTDPATWCHRIHLLPEGSVLRTRVLQSCPDFGQTLPKKYDTPAGQDKKDFGAIFTEKKAANVKAEQDRIRTQQQQAVLDKSDAVQAEVRKAEDAALASAAARKAEADTAAREAAEDLLDQKQQIRQQLDDHLKTLINKNDKQSATIAARDDVADVAVVVNAKQKWTEYEASLTDAKAKAATDVRTAEASEAKIKAASEQRTQDVAQQKADAAEAKADQELVDSAEKQARAKARDDRAQEMQTRAETREKEIAAVRQERDAALERQKLVNMEDADTAAKKAHVEDAEAAVAANRKNREDEALERQKRMDEYAKEEANIKARREAFEKAEQARDARLKKRQEEEDARVKAKAVEDARLAKAAKDDVPHEERSKQDHEEDCKDKTVTCGSGKCFQVKDDPSSKRCQCEKDVKGKNCELAACEYDVADGAGKTTKQKGNQVDGQCVRWTGSYRCTCNKPWRLELKCMKKEGVVEVQVADTKCRGLSEPENEYADETCELCPRCAKTSTTRGLAANETEVDERRRLVGAACEEVHVCGRVAYTKNPHNEPFQLLKKSALYQTVKAGDIGVCMNTCLKRRGLTGSASATRRLLRGSSHCVWFYYDEKVKRCSIFATGELPVAASQPVAPGALTGKKRKRVGTGFIGFVTHPRRWELFREAASSLPSRKFCGTGLNERYEVVFGSASATQEGDGTFVRNANRIGNDCVSVADTVLENAEGYATRMPEKMQGEDVALPTTWTTYSTASIPHPKRPTATVHSKDSKLPWHYTVDRHFRVTKVEGESSILHVGKRTDEDFEKVFNWLNDRMYNAAQSAPFCAGHLVAYQQKPPNFYFNYVPQHENSNSNGCWFLAEEAAANLIQLGCKLQYNLELDYGAHGVRTPSQIKAQMPDWAKDNPIIYKPPSKPKDGKTVGPRPPPSYVNDELKCHYRYRPYIMNLDFSISGVTATDTHCSNLHGAIAARPGTQLLRVVGDRVVTTRIFAYLLQKSKDVGDETKPGTESFKRVLGVATAMKKAAFSATDPLVCYAETGNLAPFSKMQMDFDFHDAFLGDLDHIKCLTTGTPACEKWTMVPENAGEHFGKLVTSNQKCLNDDTNGDVELEDADDLMVECGVFKYDVEGREFDQHQMMWTKGVSDTLSGIDDFIMGSVYFENGSKCLNRDRKIVKNEMIRVSPRKQESSCWKLRISYYNFPAQTRALRGQSAQETAASASDDGPTASNEGSDDDNAGAGNCAAMDFTDEWVGDHKENE